MSEESPHESRNRSTVLIVEDQEPLADLFADWLELEYDTLVAYGGNEAIEQFSDDVDVVLLDRRMPGLSGDEVLDIIRSEGFEGPVAMVTAVEPDFDIIEMGFDDYIVKPISEYELLEAVEKLLNRSNYEDTMKLFFELASKKAALETTKSDAELAESTEYAELLSELETVKARADNEVDAFGDDEDGSSFF